MAVIGVTVDAVSFYSKSDSPSPTGAASHENNSPAVNQASGGGTVNQAGGNLTIDNRVLVIRNGSERKEISLDELERHYPFGYTLFRYDGGPTPPGATVFGEMRGQPAASPDESPKTLQPSPDILTPGN